ncbi:hypothetical protein CVS40_1213 [Lucilia cuprina]|nr:hypothetical protein CVS40_1213 [Lucilia cuprina]
MFFFEDSSFSNCKREEETFKYCQHTTYFLEGKDLKEKSKTLKKIRSHVFYAYIRIRCNVIFFIYFKIKYKV